MLNQFFRISSHGSSVKTEILAGLTTFLTMAYIIFINPSMLATTGMDHGAVFVATCLAAAIGSITMGLLANYPVGMAPGMGLNAFFAFGVVGKMNGFTWQQALGAVFISGIIFLLLTITGARKWIVDGIPKSLRSAIAAGIGLFLAFIALRQSGVVINDEATLVALGDVIQPSVLYAMLGLILIAVLEYFKIRGAILIGIIAVTLLSNFLGSSQINGIISAPPSLAPTFFQMDLSFISFDISGFLSKFSEAYTNDGFYKSLKTILSGSIVHVILTFVLVELFDATGCIIAVVKRAKLLTPAHEHRFNKALMADSTAILAGSVLGTSSTTAYVESVTGVESGGRTGLTAVVIGILFLLCLFFSPLAKAVPAYATAPALIFVAGLMLRELVDIEWDNVTEVLPAGLVILITPFTYSIANGIAFGFISYTVLKIATGNFKTLHPATLLITLLFIVKFALQ